MLNAPFGEIVSKDAVSINLDGAPSETDKLSHSNDTLLLVRCVAGVFREIPEKSKSKIKKTLKGENQVSTFDF